MLSSFPHFYYSPGGHRPPPVSLKAVREPEGGVAAFAEFRIHPDNLYAHDEFGA
jgi:hypothetical protein